MLEQSLDANKLMRSESMSAEMRKKSLKVDRKKFEGIVQNLLQAKPLKRSKVKVSKRKPEKLFPPQE
ncbi:MAG: hypothetical protein WB951_01655 [Candidatus Sulfotelmatobacter sp.]|jgi:hypothetical protein